MCFSYQITIRPYFTTYIYLDFALHLYCLCSPSTLRSEWRSQCNLHCHVLRRGILPWSCCMWTGDACVLCGQTLSDCSVITKTHESRTPDGCQCGILVPNLCLSLPLKKLSHYKAWRPGVTSATIADGPNSPKQDCLFLFIYLLFFPL